MIRTFYIFLISGLLFSAANGESKPISKSPFKSQEPIRFLSREEYPTFSLTKTTDFAGIIVRDNEQDPIQKQIDFYEFKKMKQLRVSTELCSEIATSLFGNLKENSLEVKTQEIKMSKTTGKVCFLAIHNKDIEANIKEKHLFVMISNLRVMGLVFRYPKVPNQADLANEFQFIESLK